MHPFKALSAICFGPQGLVSRYSDYLFVHPDGLKHLLSNIIRITRLLG